MANQGMSIERGRLKEINQDRAIKRGQLVVVVVSIYYVTS